MVTDPEGRSSIASSNCVHWYIIGTPNGAWSTAKCKKCELITAVENSQGVTAHGKPIPRGDDEKREFLESFNMEQFAKLTEFFDTMPKIRHYVKVKNPKTEVESDVLIEGLESFLA